jgi:hypothetical protein
LLLLQEVIALPVAPLRHPTHVLTPSHLSDPSRDVGKRSDTLLLPGKIFGARRLGSFLGPLISHFIPINPLVSRELAVQTDPTKWPLGTERESVKLFRLRTLKCPVLSHYFDGIYSPSILLRIYLLSLSPFRVLSTQPITYLLHIMKLLDLPNEVLTTIVEEVRVGRDQARLARVHTILKVVVLPILYRRFTLTFECGVSPTLSFECVLRPGNAG